MISVCKAPNSAFSLHLNGVEDDLSGVSRRMTPLSQLISVKLESSLPDWLYLFQQHQTTIFLSAAPNNMPADNECDSWDAFVGVNESKSNAI